MPSPSQCIRAIPRFIQARDAGAGSGGIARLRRVWALASGISGVKTIEALARPPLARSHYDRSVSRLPFIKSWNEWAEGNYLEPDRANGTALLDVLRREVVLRSVAPT